MPTTLLAERASYLFTGAPFLGDYLLNGRTPSSPAALLVAGALASVILALILVTRHNRKLTQRIDTLRQTMNEAIIHDLKNPMTSIMGCLSVLRDNGLEESGREKLVAIALNSCRAQLTLLDTLVDSNRLECGELAPNRSPIDIGALLRQSLDGVRGTAEFLGVRIEEQLGASLPSHISVDPDLFPRVILNLLHNALKYTPKGGVVKLSANAAEGDLRFKIHDTGCGIGQEHLARLFGKYYRIEGGDQTSRRGTGLGLYFCRLVVEAHGGAISVASELGKGTTISIGIPLDGHGSQRP